jgi:hypothetical protein
VVGRLGIGPGPAQQIPFGILGGNLFGAQPAHSVILGEGAGIPLGSAGPGTSGLPLVSNGAGADPGYQALTNAGLANMAASSEKCNPTVSPAAAQDCVISSSNKVVYVSTAGNDSNDGLSWQSAKLTLQAAQNAANPNGLINVASGTYTLGSTLSPQPGVRMTCAPGTIITQGNAANINPLIDFSTNSANSASIDHCTIDGNRANNTDDNGTGAIDMVRVGTANDVILEFNTFRNGNGNLVSITSGLKPLVRFNRFFNFFTMAVNVITGIAGNGTEGQFIDNLITGPIGQHGFYLVQSNNNVICRNTIDAGTIIGAPGSLLHVTTAGTAVTWVSGPTFANAVAGQVLVINSGQEFLIRTVNSTTSLTLNTSAGTLTNVLAAIGAGDLINPNNSSYLEICDNTLVGSVSDGISPFNGVVPAGETAQKLNIHGNNILNSGEYGIFIASVAGGSQVNDIKIFGNLIVNAGQVGAAGGTFYGIGVNGTQINNIWVDGNTIRDDTGTMANWMITSTNAGQVFVGANSYIGTVNQGIANGISSITLSAGWGNTATTDQIQSEGNAVFFRINSSGAGQAANPTFTVNTNATKAPSAKLTQCKHVGGNGTGTILFGESASSATAIGPVTYVGTPVAAQSYQIVCQ